MNALVAVLALAGFGTLLVVAVVGRIAYSARRSGGAKAVRVSPEIIGGLRALHPEVKWEPERIDRNDVYLGVLVALWLLAVGILLIPVGQGALGGVPPLTQDLLAVCLLVGTSLSLLAAATAEPHWRCPRWLSPFTWKIRHAYLLGFAGLIAVAVSLGFFALVIVANSTLVGNISGALMPILFIVYLRMAVKLLRAYRSMARADSALKARVMARINGSDDDDAD